VLWKWVIDHHFWLLLSRIGLGNRLWFRSVLQLGGERQFKDKMLRVATRWRNISLLTSHSRFNLQSVCVSSVSLLASDAIFGGEF
jgi:hypothetical protein